jgi:hypothetical protein
MWGDVRHHNSHVNSYLKTIHVFNSVKKKKLVQDLLDDLDDSDDDKDDESKEEEE